MGAGQIGGLASLLDFDFNNAAGFAGSPASNIDGQFVVYYFSHAMLFCAGALIEPHVVLTPAVCVYTEDQKFEVFGGSHRFQDSIGASRHVDSICVHKAYNHSRRYDHCPTDNIALLVLQKPFGFRVHEPNAEFVMNRVRYGLSLDTLLEKTPEPKCRYFGWGSRRNGFLIPLLINLYKVETKIYTDYRKCEEIWNTDNKFLCMSRPQCITEKYGVLCPDDLGSVVVCGGYVMGMMTSELIDRPCGVGFLNLDLYAKYLQCAVDDSRDAIDEVLPEPPAMSTGALVTLKANTSTTPCENCEPNVTLSKPTTMDKASVAESILTTTKKTGRYANRLRHMYRPVNMYRPVLVRGIRQ